MNYRAATNPEITDRERRNAARVWKIAPAGMVLLENRGLLPLKKAPEEIALFGSGARRTIKGGTGSGDVNCRSFSTVEDGLKKAGIRTAGGTWMDRYDVLCRAHMDEHMKWVRKVLAEEGPAGFIKLLETPYHEPEEPPITEADLEPECVKQLAVYVLSRVSGEGRDRRVEPGDYELSDREKANIGFLCDHFGGVIVLLNVGGPVDTRFLRSRENIGAVLLMSQAGIASGQSVADVLTGKAVPSGRLAATWAERYEDYPTAETFGHRNGDLDDEYYTDGIYVGYRWFDSFDVEPAYPFGYGLSYTTFSHSDVHTDVRDGKVSVRLTVRNTGDEAGQEVVQVYVSAPEGCLEKPYQELMGFRKTRLLNPGEAETVEIVFPVSAMASYDEARAAWILEKGEYILRVGSHSRSTHVAAVLTLSETAVTEQLTNRLVPEKPLKNLSRGGHPCRTYEGEAREIEDAMRIALTAPACAAPQPAEKPAWPEGAPQDVVLADVRAGKMSLEAFIAALKPEELAALCVGSARQGPGSTSMIGIASEACPGAAGETTSDLAESRGIPAAIMADGPAGLRLSKHFVASGDGKLIPGLGDLAIPGLGELLGVAKPERPADAVDYYQYCTAIPIATLLAQTWDEALIAEAGNIIGEEMEELGIHLWLAPGMNIQRNPLCGRNFEYFSEDPMLSGKCAAAEVRGVQAHPGRGACIKHFAMNNQEDNREHVNAHCGERAIREIYLKGFRIAVEESTPLTLMSSYNLLNGVHTANNRELLTDICRDEWHYGGMVMTDWGTTGAGSLNAAIEKKYGFSDPAACVRAGNDLIMPGSEKDIDGIVRAVKDGSLSMDALRTSALRVVQTVLLTEDTP